MTELDACSSPDANSVDPSRRRLAHSLHHTRGRSRRTSYYHDHREEIQEEIRVERALAEEFRRNAPSALPAKLNRPPIKEAS